VAPESPARLPSVRIGDLEITPLSDGFFRLDGGAMFGVVPKLLWEKRTPADDRNRIRLAMRPLLVRGVRTMIVDAGIGDKGDAKFVDIYGLDRVRHLDHTMADAGLEAAAIDLVLATHLHFDHAGGFTANGPDGIPRPRFPRAQYIVRRGEWEDATHPNERTRASYLPENFEPLAAHGVLQLLSDDATVMPGVRVQRTGGHTKHHQIVYFGSGTETAVLAADLVPTSAHLGEPWIMAYDLYPLETLEVKRAFLRDAVERGYLVFFSHDPEVAAGYIREDAKGRRFVERVL
jgi:glyoxylase-like metal-dependent hydrolase (beta-lactamase superfamily II)